MFYKISKLGKKVHGISATEPVRGTLDAVLKQDGENSPCCVYNELVSQRLAHRLGVHLAMGVPSVGDGGTYFASLVVGGLSINLPNVSARKMASVAKRYPREAAGIFVFDVWALNPDREGNIKANLTTTDLHLVAGIDQEQALLGCFPEPQESLDALLAMDVPKHHPFRGMLTAAHLEFWIKEVAVLSDEAIDAAVVLGFSVSGVHGQIQRRLARAMKARRDQIALLVSRACA